MKILCAFALLPSAVLAFTDRSPWAVSHDESPATFRAAPAALLPRPVPVATGRRRLVRQQRGGGPSSVWQLSAAGREALGLLTFDLDDSLYPIEPVMDEANAAFCRAMDRFGFSDGNILPQSIAETCQRIRRELPPAESVALTHTQVRRMAIRREMESVIYKRKLQETADDWATPLSDLSPIVKNFAKKWAKEAVSESIVQAVLNAWEMERHHAAERHLYREVIPVLEEIRRDHPGVIIGAVTDGKANPMLMTFTLARHFDFCTSWEDDQVGRTKFFSDLTSVSGNAELKWIYDAARETYHELHAAQQVLRGRPAFRLPDGGEGGPGGGPGGGDRSSIWIHVGDDLAYDVGGSAQSGARTIWLELDEAQYRQTARFLFDKPTQPSWSTSTPQELERRRVLSELALPKVDKRVRFLSRLPEAIQDVVDKVNRERDSAAAGEEEPPVAASVNRGDTTLE